MPKSTFKYYTADQLGHGSKTITSQPEYAFVRKSTTEFYLIKLKGKGYENRSFCKIDLNNKVYQVTIYYKKRVLDITPN